MGVSDGRVLMMEKHMDDSGKVSLPFGSGRITADFADFPVRVLAPAPWTERSGSPEAIIGAALEQPVAGPRLRDLARDASSMVVITSDHTRSMPSKITLPALFAEARRHRPSLPIILIVGTGLHRSPGEGEVEERFGRGILSTCELAVHDATSAEELVDLGMLSTGNQLLVNRPVPSACRNQRKRTGTTATECKPAERHR